MDIIDFDKEAETMIKPFRLIVSSDAYNGLLNGVSSNLLRLAAQAQMTPREEYDYEIALRELLSD